MGGAELCKFWEILGKFWDRLGRYFFVVKPKSMTAAFQLPLGTHRIRSPRHHAFYRTARLFPFFSEKTAEKNQTKFPASNSFFSVTSTYYGAGAVAR